MPIFVGAGTSSFMKGGDGVGVSTMTTAQRNALSGVKKGQFIYNETLNLAEYYDGNSWKSIDSPPSITAFTLDGGSDVTTAKINREGGGNATIVVKGSNFDITAGTVVFEPESGGSNVTVQSITRNSTSQFTVTVQRSDFIEANDPYAIKLTNGSGLASTLAGALDVNTPPSFVNSANAVLASIVNGGATLSGSTANASATDPDGDAITYSIVSGSLPSGLTLGSSNGYITGAVSGVTVQTYTFTVRATTSISSSDRQFLVVVAATPTGGNITTNGGYTYHSFTSSGTFTVYSGFTPNIEVFMMGAGGGGGSWVPAGGGAGGCVNLDSPASLATTAQAYTVTIGGGGLGMINPGSYNWPSSQVNSVTGTDTTLRDAGGTYLLTAIGGGRGGSYDGNGNPAVGQGRNGGCGGGKGRTDMPNGNGQQTSAASTPLGLPVSANSRTYGIGSNGGSSSSNEGYGQEGGGGLTSSERSGGNGKHGQEFTWVSFLNIGTNSSNNASSGGYFGGGGGAGHHSGGGVGSGGDGGGAQGRSNSGTKAPSGLANTGGGGGGGGRPGGSYSEGGNGGSGVLILRYTLS